MRKKRLALLDPDPAYTSRFAGYGNQRDSLLVEIFPFTERQELDRFLERQAVDAVLAPPGEAESLEKQVGQVLVLAEQRPAPEDARAIYRYQPCGQILREAAVRMGQEPVPAPVESSAQIYGVYSPVHRCYKTTFSLILGQLLAERGAALYLNLEEYAGFPALLEKEYREDLSDLFYRRRVGQEEQRPPDGMEYLGKLAYLPPVSCPEDIREAPPREVAALIRELGAGGGYDFLVIDCGEALADPVPVLELCQRVYMPVCSDRASQVKADAFERYLRQLGREALGERIYRLTLPYYSWLAGGCRDYRGLRWTAFGKYVQNLLREEENVWKSRGNCRKP